MTDEKAIRDALRSIDDVEADIRGCETALTRIRLRLAGLLTQERRPVPLRHGVNCHKAAHSHLRNGYLHTRDDDTPYDVDGVAYCGRCHLVLGQREEE